VSKAPDENDKHRAGTLDPNPEAGTKAVVTPIRKGEEPPRVLTVRQIMEASAARARDRNAVSACTTGHHVLDDATGGICPGEGWVFGGASSWGKSSWLVSVADENIKRGKRVLIVSVEDSETIYGNRLLARRSGVSARRLKKRRLSAWDEEQIDAVMQRAEPLPVFLDARGKSAEWTAKVVEQVVKAENIDLVCYDYLQEFTSEREAENHRLTVKKIAGVLRTPVARLGKSSVLFTQLTFDASVKRKHPDRDMIRDCRDVANAATVILLGYTPDEAIETDKGDIVVAQGQKAVWVDKVKEGPAKFAVGLDWDDETASFATVKGPPGAYDEFDTHFEDPTAVRYGE
jgi:replicative DNA helicase